MDFGGVLLDSLFLLNGLTESTLLEGKFEAALPCVLHARLLSVRKVLTLTHHNGSAGLFHLGISDAVYD